VYCRIAAGFPAAFLFEEFPMDDPIKLNISADGQITWNGQPFLWAAFFQSIAAATKPVDVLATQIPHPFAFNNTQYQRSDWLLRHTDGSFAAVSNADFQTEYAPKA
jgi:hypothetical protein